jgi:hypothetical protein
MVRDRDIDAGIPDVLQHRNGGNTTTDCLGSRVLIWLYAKPVLACEGEQDVTPAATKIKHGIGIPDKRAEDASLDWAHARSEV